MYQHGWKRPVDYVLAFSQYDVSDVTRRYCNDDRQALQKRRTRCPEDLLEAKLLAVYKELQKDLSAKKREYLRWRMLLDSIAMFQLREPTEDERKGRSSGDLEWRESRGEQSLDAFYVFHLSDEEAARKEFNLRYSTAKDVYETFVKGGAEGQPTILSTAKSWNSRIYSARNVFRKEEHDWKMVYLARTEGTNEAVIEWKVDVSTRKMTIKDLKLTFDTKVYENATVKVEFVINNGEFCFCSFSIFQSQFDLQFLHLTGEVVTDREKVRNCSSVIVRATLVGGRGDNSWQHSQIFRQEMKSTEHPFLLSITFN